MQHRRSCNLRAQEAVVRIPERPLDYALEIPIDRINPVWLVLTQRVDPGSLTANS